MALTPNPQDASIAPLPFVPIVSGNIHDTEELNSLLRGEISAAQTYTMAIDKVSESEKSQADDIEMLRQIQRDHGRACQILRERIRRLGGEPAESSGAWGAWAKTIEGAAGLFGDRAALKALKEGEEHGLKEYDRAIEEIDIVSAQLMSSDFIPAQERHIRMLDEMLEDLKN